MPGEADFSKGIRGLHHIPSGTKVYLPASIERSVWEYFSSKAKERGVGLAELLSEVLQRDIEIGKRSSSPSRNEIGPTQAWVY